MILTVRVQDGKPVEDSGGRRESRGRIYPHRSVRYVDVGRKRIVAGVMLAAVITFLTAWYAVPLMDLHGVVARGMMQAAGLEAAEWVDVEVFPGLQPASAPRIEIPDFQHVAEGARLGLVMSIVVLLVLWRKYSLFRNLANFLIVLLLGSALVNTVLDTFVLSSAVFGQIWLRQEIMVWLLMPWVTLLLFVVPQPDLARGLGWVVFLQAYGFVFSALRMVFILGVLHYTGLLFMPVLWFALGTLADLIFVLFFYSITVYRTSGRLWGTRAAWQSQF
jgi:hypothetical protein